MVGGMYRFWTPLFAFCSFNEIVKSDKSNLTNDISRGKWEKGRNVSWKGEIGTRNRRASTLVKIYNLENITRLWGCWFSSGMTTGFIKRQIEGPKRGWREGRRRRGRKGDDGDDDNGERLLTKIEVVVMTGIARDEALRGDALVDALASSEKKTERLRGWEE